jgi:hypothetical protein
MPAGRYMIIGDDGDPVGTETFRCAPGPAGWRYVSDVETEEHGRHREVVDVAVDAAWRIARVRLDSGAHRLALEPRDGALRGERDGDDVDLEWRPDDHLDYLTPATNLVTTRRLGGTSEIDVVYLAPFSMEASRVRQRYELVGSEEVATPVGRFAADRWVYASLDTGWTSDLWVAGDVVVRFDRIFELVEYEAGAHGPRVLSDPPAGG